MVGLNRLQRREGRPRGVVGAGHRADLDQRRAAERVIGGAHCLPLARSRSVGVGADLADAALERVIRSEEHTSELQSLMRISYAVFCLKKKKIQKKHNKT